MAFNLVTRLQLLCKLFLEYKCAVKLSVIRWRIFSLPSSAIVSKMQKKGINVIFGVH